MAQASARGIPTINEPSFTEDVGQDTLSSGPESNSTAQTSSIEADNGAEASGLRASIDAAIGRVRRSTDSSEQEPKPRRRRLSALVPRRRRKRPGLEHSPSTATSSLLSEPNSRRQSVSSTLFDDTHNGSGRSSLLTDDLDLSDAEDSKAERPNLISHPSHTGYLTSSSPEISASITPSEPRTSNSLGRAPATSEDSTKTSPPLHNDGTTVESPARSLDRSSQSIRNPSAAGRLLDVFAVARKKPGEVSPKSSEKERLITGFPQEQGSSKIEPSQRPRFDTKDVPQPFPDFDDRVGIVRQKSSLFPAHSTQEVEVEQQTGNRSTDRSEAPATFVTPPTPTDLAAEFAGAAKGTPSHVRPSTSPDGLLSSVPSIKHRRAQSASTAGRLSASIPPALTPTVEEAKTPGGTLTQPTIATGFFSTFITGAQKAADQLNNTINFSIGAGKSKVTPTRKPQQVDGTSADSEEFGSALRNLAGAKLRTVDTLGQGNLSLRHLGIDESRGTSPMSSTQQLPQPDASSQNGSVPKKAGDELANRVASSATEKPVANAPLGRPASIASNDATTNPGDQTSPRSAADSDPLKRSNSVRSKLSNRKRRQRNSSANTSTIGAALQSTTAGLANMQANGPGHRLTGFAVASSRRNKDFHQLFRSVPEDDYLIEDYSAALQRDILLHGRLYVSEGHICFSSNILGWITNLVISFDEVVSVEKKSTAVIFPNAIVIQTLHARNTFASFVARDSTYELLIGIWKISHPNLKSSLNGVTLDNAGTGDKTEVADPDDSAHGSDEGSDDEVYDEDDDDDDDDAGSFTDGGVGGSIADSEQGDHVLSRQPSGVLSQQPVQPNSMTAKPTDSADVNASSATGADFPGPLTHAVTECGEASEHYDRPLTDTTIAAPLGKVYSFMFGPASGAFMRKWLVDEQKSRELNYPDDKTGLDNEHKTFAFDYIKPLGGPVGPRQTKCITTNNLLAFDLEKAVTIDCSTSTPDVPSGNVFTTRTRYCLMWGPSNSTRIVASCAIEWSGKSWLKGPIEKGANDGQIEYVKSIVAALKTVVASKPTNKVLTKKGKRKGKKEASDTLDARSDAEHKNDPKIQRAHWGIFEPVRAIVEPVIDLVTPYLTSQVMIAVLLTLLVYTWLSPPTGASGLAHSKFTTPERVTSYEDMWRREEGELWDWLDGRVGLEGASRTINKMGDERRKQNGHGQNPSKKWDEERMSMRQINDAIRTTEKRLSELKGALSREHGLELP